MRDGELLDRTPIVLDEATLARLAERDSETGPRLGRVELAKIAYASGGLRVSGLLARPRAKGPHPSVIYNRGGYGATGVISARQAATQLAPIAERGYIVVATQYRGSAGSAGTDEFGGGDLADVLNLVPLLDDMPDADPDRIGMWGWSRGGLMTYLAMARTDRLRAAIVLSAVSDLADYLAHRPEMRERVFAKLLPEASTEREAAITDRSPVRWANRLCKTTPLLVMHGSADWRVPARQALAMAAALQATLHPFRFVLFEGADHGLAEFSAEAQRFAHEWLDRYLRDRLPWPSLEPHGL